MRFSTFALWNWPLSGEVRADERGSNRTLADQLNLLGGPVTAAIYSN
jgi:hypothetical protein